MNITKKIDKLENTLAKNFILIALISSVDESIIDADAINGIKKLATQIKIDLSKCISFSEDYREFLEDKGIIQNKIKDILNKIG